MDRSELNHRDLGLSDRRVVDLYAVMRLARRLDERLWALNRQGRIAFFVGASGHEAVQAASVFALDRETDWIVPYYRDLAAVLAWGLDPADVVLAAFAREGDPFSGGRQLPNHWSDPAARIISQSSTIGTQFPHAVGIAHALRSEGRPGVVVVYGGEGSTSEGDWHEAMNWAGIHRLPVVFIIENNRYAISVPEHEQVGGRIVDRAPGYGMVGEVVDGNDALAVYRVVRDAAERARAGEGPTLIEAETYRYYAHTSDDDDRLYRNAEEVLAWRRRDPVERLRQRLIEERLLPESLEAEIDAEIGTLLAAAVREAESAPPPRDLLGHVYANPISPETPAGPEAPVAGEIVNLITAVNRAIHETMAARPDVVVFGEDVGGEKGGVFKATAGVEAAFGPERCFNTPIAESAIVGAAIGMAAAGLRPIAEIQFADYLHPAFDQIVSEAARIHYRSAGRWTCPIVIRAPFGGGIRGGLYHSQSVESLYAHIPGLKVVVPSTPADVKGLLASAVDDPDPVLFLEPKKLYRLGTGPYPEGDHIVPLGRAAIRREGTDLTVVTYGAMTHFSLEAAAALDELGVSAEVIDLRTLRPLDWPTVEASVRKTSRILIVHEDNEFLGYGAEVAAQAAEKAFEWLDAPVRRYAAAEIPAFPFDAELEAAAYPGTAGIIMRALELAKY